MKPLLANGFIKHLENPVAIFSYGDKNKTQNIIVELQQGDKNYLVGLHFNQAPRGIAINDIRGLFPKDTEKWLAWIEQGKALYLDKNKVQKLINQQRTNLAEVENLNLDSINNIVDNLENVNTKIENNSKNNKNISVPDRHHRPNYSLKRQDYQIDSDIRESARARIVALWNNENLKHLPDENINIGRVSPQVLVILKEKFHITNANQNMQYNLKLSELRHIKNGHSDLTTEDVAGLIDVLDSPTHIGFSKGENKGITIRLLQAHAKGDKLGITIYGGKNNTANVKTFYHPEKTGQTLSQWKKSGVHVEVVAKSTQQLDNSKGLGAIQEFITPTTTPAIDNINDNSENVNSDFENNAEKVDDKEYSIKKIAKTKQVNPIMQDGLAKDNYQNFLGQVWNNSDWL